MFEQEWLPQALSIGISEKEFWHMNPRRIKPYIKAHELKKKERDEDMWFMGHYVLSAVSVAIDRCINGKKATSEYIKRPLFSEIMEECNMTQEEIDKREIQKMIKNEEEWIYLHKQHGLPETQLD